MIKGTLSLGKKAAIAAAAVVVMAAAAAGIFVTSTWDDELATLSALEIFPDFLYGNFAVI